MKRLLTFSICISVILSILTCSKNGGQVTIANPENALIAKLAGFERKGNIKIYNRDNLWNFIDGAAESYISYGFLKAAAANYKNGLDEIDVQIYSFEKPIGAFGIYGENRTPQQNFIAIGAEAFTSPGYLLFYKGEFFVRIGSFNQNIDIGALKRVAQKIDNELNVTAKLPKEYDRFPRESYVNHTERYIPSGFLFSEDLLGVFTVEAALDGGSATMFYFQDPSGLTKLKAWISRSGTAIEVTQYPYKAIFKNGDAKENIIASQVGWFCYGVLSLESNSKLDTLFNSFSANIKSIK